MKEFNYNEQEIYEYYKRSFDVYMVGMTILHAIFKFDLTDNIDILSKLVEKFTSLIHPLDINGAIEVFNGYMMKLN